MYRFKTACILLLLALCVPITLDAARAPDWKHEDIWLKNEQGQHITPTRNSADAYSPHRTCGTCHGYMTITSGTHFQQGFDEMKDGYDPKRPWVLSPGVFGKGGAPGTFTERVAAKKNAGARDMGLSTYDWIAGGGKGQSIVLSAGNLHPGGGPLEYGRKADGRRDLSKNLIQGEREKSAPLDGDYTSRHTPDGKSRFRESGVVEGDCLMCHLKGYRLDRRNDQLARRNYRWAASAGAGLGEIKGAVFTPARPDASQEDGTSPRGEWNFTRRPVVQYAWDNRKLFTPQGKFRGSTLISKSVETDNCTQCHRVMDGQKSGTLYLPAGDLHLKAGLRCTDCHTLAGRTQTERLRHHIGKGWSPTSTARSDLDGTGMKTCAACHLEGQYKQTRAGMPKEAKNPDNIHRSLFHKATFHFYLIHCSTCHASERKTRSVYLVDHSTGQPAWYSTDKTALITRAEDMKQFTPELWKPWMDRHVRVKGDGERYVAAVPKVRQWFGEMLSEGVVRPIGMEYVRKAAAGQKKLTTVEVVTLNGEKVKQTTVATEEDIRTMIRALTDMGFRNVVFVADQLYELKNDKLQGSPAPALTQAVMFPIYHGNMPVSAKKTLGQKGNKDGCADCHADNSPFFTKLKVRGVGKFLKDSYPTPKEPIAEPQLVDWGMTGVPPSE
jgi:cytochrome c553